MFSIKVEDSGSAEAAQVPTPAMRARLERAVLGVRLMVVGFVLVNMIDLVLMYVGPSFMATRNQAVWVGNACFVAGVAASLASSEGWLLPGAVAAAGVLMVPKLGTVAFAIAVVRASGMLKEYGWTGLWGAPKTVSPKA